MRMCTIKYILIFVVSMCVCQNCLAQSPVDPNSCIANGGIPVPHPFIDFKFFCSYPPPPPPPPAVVAPPPPPPPPPAVPCPANTYGPSGNCQDCPTNSVSPTGSISKSDCECKPGTSGSDNENCIRCDDGQYKEFIGMEPCQNCESGKYGYANKMICRDCAIGSTSPSKSDEKSDCVCDIGNEMMIKNQNRRILQLSYDVPFCETCPLGKYKNTIGNTLCDFCDSGTYPNITGTTCASCPSRSSIHISEGFAIDIYNCKCNKGSTGPDGGPCTICAAGKYKDTTGSAGSCTSCGINTYSNSQGAISSSTCIKCPARSSSPIGSDSPGNCKCDTGYTEISVGVCDECEIGKYKSETGSSVCVVCEAGKKMKTGSSGCVDCGAGKYSTTDISDVCADCPLASSSSHASTNVGDCTCNEGYSGNNGDVCNQCVSGKYKNNIGDAKCEDCPLNSVSNILLTDCTCERGSTRKFSGICVLCVAGKYKDYIGDQECTMCTTGESSTVVGSVTKDECEACAAGKYKDSSNICVDCQQYSSSSTGAEYCDCNAGYIKQNDVCVICNIGTYKFNSANCESCPAGSTSESGSNSKTDCECDSGYSGTNGGACTSCPSGTYKVSLGTASCTNCVSGTYSINSGATANTTCLDCPTLTTSPAGSNALIDCTCSSGSTINPLVSEFLCVLCSPRRYKSVAGTAVCDQCPKNSISLRGADNIDDCLCEAGYYNSNDKDLECVACKDGSKKETIGTGVCTKHTPIDTNYKSCSVCL